MKLTESLNISDAVERRRKANEMCGGRRSAEVCASLNQSRVGIIIIHVCLERETSSGIQVHHDLPGPFCTQQGGTKLNYLVSRNPIQKLLHARSSANWTPDILLAQPLSIS